MNRALSTLLTLTGIAGAYYVTLGRWHLGEMADLNREIETCYASFDRAEIEATQVTNLQNTVQDLERWHKELQRRLTVDPLEAPTTAATRAALEEHGLRVERAEPMGVDTALTLPHQRTRVVATGDFRALFAAITALENESAPARITDLSVQATADATTVRTELTLVRTWSIAR